MALTRQSNARTGTPALFGRAAIYARMSLDKPGEAAGVGRKIDACRHLAEVKGWSVDESPPSLRPTARIGGLVLRE